MRRIDFNLITRDHDQIYFYEGQPFTGVAYDLTQDGVLADEQTFALGVLDGPSRSWYATGKLESETIITTS
jgi:antitoxin component YwqK of YwqJK toxin-antitoxin module